MGLVVAAIRPLLAACKVEPVPTAPTLTPANVATPATALTVTVPESVALPGLAESDRVTGPVKLVSTAPLAVSAVNARPKPVPAATLPGGRVVGTSCVAAPETTLIAPEVETPSPPPETAMV